MLAVVVFLPVRNSPSFSHPFFLCGPPLCTLVSPSVCFVCVSYVPAFRKKSKNKDLMKKKKKGNKIQKSHLNSPPKLRKSLYVFQTEWRMAPPNARCCLPPPSLRSLSLYLSLYLLSLTMYVLRCAVNKVQRRCHNANKDLKKYSREYSY